MVADGTLRLVPKELLDSTPAGPPSRSRPDQRWRVVLVRVPEVARSAVLSVLPGDRQLSTGDLPLVIRTTGDRNKAQLTAFRLRDAGAVVLVMEEPAEGDGAFCEEHPDRVAARACVGCGRPVCPSCRDAANGEDVCGACRQKGRSPRSRTRRRQLFVLFLFMVFLYEVIDFLQADQRAVDPNGRVRVAVFQFVPPDVPYAPVVEELNRAADPTTPPTSLYDVADWYNAERARYGRPGTYLDIEVFGPWGRVVDAPDLDDPDLPIRQIRVLCGQVPGRCG